MDKVFNKIGTAGPASISITNLERRNRLKKIAEETTNLLKDPYFYKNHIGIYECKLCLTLHNSEGSYLAHSQGRRHQTNLARRKLTEAKNELRTQEYKNEFKEKQENLKIKYVKIGMPAYRITKEKDYMTHKKKIKFEIEYPLIKDKITPQFRIMSDIEVNSQKNKEEGNNENDKEEENKYHYVVFAAEPYENIAVKIPNYPLDYNAEKHFFYWDEAKKIFYLTLNYK